MTTRLTQDPSKLFGKLSKLRETGDRRGRLVGLPIFKEHISFLEGFPITIGADEHMGKTTFINELCLADVFEHDKNWLLFSPESGTSEQYMVDLIDQMGNGERFYKNHNGRPSKFAMSDAKFAQCVAQLENNIRILDPFYWREILGKNTEFDIRTLLDAIENEERAMKAKFDVISLDPLNELALTGGSISEQMKNGLNELIWYCREKNKIIILGSHINELKTFMSEDVNKNKFYQEVEPQTKDFQGGRQTGRKMYQVIFLMRPQKEVVEKLALLNNDAYAQHSMENGYNMTLVKIAKSKPEGVGKRGKFPIFFDTHKMKYYELKEGRRVYAF